VVKREAQNVEVYIEEGGLLLRGIPGGRLREKERIYAGDHVRGKFEGDIFFIEEVEPRKNLLVRPPVANVDCVIVVTTLKTPDFNSFLMDNLLAVYECAGTDVLILFNKIDILDEEEKEELKKWIGLYKGVGYEVLGVSAEREINMDRLTDFLKKGIYVLAGASGTGKSTLLSKLTGVSLRKGEISKKTGKGRHTTTGVNLIRLKKNTYIGDTPGFSKVYANTIVDRNKIRECFREFKSYECKFKDCMHISEEGCGVIEAVKKGEISKERYDNYKRILKYYR